MHNRYMMKFYEFCVYSLKHAGWAPVLVFSFHVIAVIGFDAYRHFPMLDIPMHFLGGVVICYFFYVATNAPHSEIFLGKHTKFSLFILLMALTGLTTVLWEFAEWISDAYFSQNAQPSVTDTMGDMLLGLLGALTVCARILIKK